MGRMTVIARVRPEKRVEFLQSMDSLTKAAGKSASCGKLMIYSDVNQPNLFKPSFEWMKNQGFKHYLESEGCSSVHRQAYAAEVVACLTTLFRHETLVAVVQTTLHRVIGRGRRNGDRANCGSTGVLGPGRAPAASML